MNTPEKMAEASNSAPQKLLSCADWFATLPELEQRKRIAALSDEKAQALLYDWSWHARPNQLPPTGNWTNWLILAGRGWGKTKTGAEWVRGKATDTTPRRIALVAATASDARDVMVEGESGILACSSPSDRPLYEPSKRRLTWKNGSMATTYSADEPDRLRGPQHDAAWCDEIAAWRYPDAWDMLVMGLRLGDNPQAVITSTPRPIKIIKELAAAKDTVVTRGSTYENRANLAESFFTQIIGKYEGTRLGRQELYAEILIDNPGALWKREQIDSLRVHAAPPLRRIVVAIDPAVTTGDNSDETGIVGCGMGEDKHSYILKDSSMRGSPDEWARAAVRLYYELEADIIIGETNNGGDMIETILRTIDPNIPYRGVHASRGKMIRAEPISALYEQGKVHHVGMFAKLEDQMCDWHPSMGGKSPDRMDALVWGLTELMIVPQTTGMLDFYASMSKMRDR